jgi:hypothetical protein
LLIPSQPAWYVLDAGDLRAWGWNGKSSCATVAGQTCQIYPPDPTAHAAALDRVERLSAKSKAWSKEPASVNPDQDLLALPANLGDQVEFLGYELQDPSARPDLISLLTAWRVTSLPSGSRAIFVHLLAPEGRIIAQWDGLDVAVEGWRAGDTFIQRVTLGWPQGMAPGQYQLQVGVYNPDTMERLPVMVNDQAVADRILLQSVSPIQKP